MVPEIDIDDFFDVLSTTPPEYAFEAPDLDMDDLLDLVDYADSRAPTYQPMADCDDMSARLAYINPGSHAIGSARLEWMMTPMFERLGIVRADDFEFETAGLV